MGAPERMTAAELREAQAHHARTGRWPWETAPADPTSALGNPPNLSPSEAESQQSIVAWWRANVAETDARLLHVPMGSRSAPQRAWDARMGAVAGTPDLLLMLPGERGVWVELKCADGTQSGAQQDFERSCG